MPIDYSGSVLITGGTSGVGYNCALAIARQRPDYKVIIASRSDSGKSAEAINKLLGYDNVEFIQLDLSNLANVRSFLTRWQDSQLPPIQALLLNAALQFPGGVAYSVDGFEKTFAISHIGHFLLFSLLRPYFTRNARIVITSSATHDPLQQTGMPEAQYDSAEQLAHPTTESALVPGRQRYTSTKLANVMYGYCLHRRFQAINMHHGKQWTVTILDPGLVPGTGLSREAHPILTWFWVNVLPNIIPFLRLLLSPNVHSVEESGAALARLAIGTTVEGKSGVYYQGLKEIKSSEDSYDQKKQEDLWQWTLNAVAQDEDEMKFFDFHDLC
jgi:NAD(P)-dependent dehydrogenase (short-subunit alcohol dehydrogenase family)